MDSGSTPRNERKAGEGRMDLVTNDDGWTMERAIGRRSG